MFVYIYIFQCGGRRVDANFDLLFDQHSQCVYNVFISDDGPVEFDRTLIDREMANGQLLIEALHYAFSSFHHVPLRVHFLHYPLEGVDIHFDLLARC